MKRFLFSLLFITIMARAGDWPAWRGPNHDGSCGETGLPLSWSVPDNKNILWSVELPSPGNSTPIVWGEKVFVTQSHDKGSRRELLCFNKKTGAKLWASGIDYNENEPTHATNPHCSGSPATDGERVIVNFASAGVFCYDGNGKELWRRDLGLQHHMWGSGTSPVIVGDICVLNHGPGEKARLVALDKKTGEIRWEQAEPIREGDKDGARGFYGSWSDPLPRLIDGKWQLFHSWPYRVCAVDAQSGKEIWTCDGLNALVYTSPLLADEILVSMGGFNGRAVGVRFGGQGNVTESHRLWNHEKSPQRIGSGAIHEGHVYILNDSGVAQCLDIRTGEEKWNERLKGAGASGQNWSSIVLAEGLCYAVNQGGDAFVFKASPKFELVSTNPMGEKIIGSIAVSDGMLFIRGHKHLFCVGRK